MIFVMVGSPIPTSLMPPSLYRGALTEHPNMDVWTQNPSITASVDEWVVQVSMSNTVSVSAHWSVREGRNGITISSQCMYVSLLGGVTIQCGYPDEEHHTG